MNFLYGVPFTCINESSLSCLVFGRYPTITVASGCPEVFKRSQNLLFMFTLSLQGILHCTLDYLGLWSINCHFLNRYKFVALWCKDNLFSNGDKSSVIPKKYEGIIACSILCFNNISWISKLSKLLFLIRIFHLIYQHMLVSLYFTSYRKCLANFWDQDINSRASRLWHDALLNTLYCTLQLASTAVSLKW